MVIEPQFKKFKKKKTELQRKSKKIPTFIPWKAFANSARWRFSSLKYWVTQRNHKIETIVRDMNNELEETAGDFIMHSKRCNIIWVLLSIRIFQIYVCRQNKSKKSFWLICRQNKCRCKDSLKFRNMKSDTEDFSVWVEEKSTYSE